MMPPSWSFAVWRLDILGPFHRAVRGYRCLYVTIDKFTKWPEATPVVKINKQSIVKYIKSIIYRFRVPNRIITDNRSQFTSSAYQGYCEDLGLNIRYASIAHPESNGQVERANTKILKGLKTHTYDGLRKHGKKWINELPCALLGNWTSLSQDTREMPFFMVYAVEAVLPQEVTMGSLRVQAYDKAMQDQLWLEDIDLIDERRWQYTIKNARYQQALKWCKEQFVRSRELQVDDLVLWQVLTREGANKLSPGWEGPFRVTQVCRHGCVLLAMEDGEPLHNPWNIE
jgi:transposase InsO family protein